MQMLTPEMSVFGDGGDGGDDGGDGGDDGGGGGGGGDDGTGSLTFGHAGPYRRMDGRNPELRFFQVRSESSCLA